MGSLAACLRVQKKYDEAEELYSEVLAAWGKLPGHSDHEMLWTVLALAHLKEDQQALA